MAFLEITPRGELKEFISLVQGHIPDAILKVERERCPGAVSHIAFGRFGNSPGRPNAGLPGAGCPGSGSVVRYHEARDRIEPRPRGVGESRGRAPRGERVSQRDAHRDERYEQAATLVWRARGIYSAPFGAPPPFLGRSFLQWLGKPRCASKKRSARTRLHCFPSPFMGAT